MMKNVDTSVDYGKLFKRHDLQGPLLWKLYRTEEDKYFVEIIILFALLNCHTNFKLLTSFDQDGSVEDYLNGRLTNISEKRLEGAMPTILSAAYHTKEV